jgi:curved DNA-binding protein
VEYKDYYKTLNVSKTATSAQIKKEYRKLARKYHPDVNKNADAEQNFKEVGEAYEVLKDSEKRKAFDQYGANWKAGKSQQQYQQQGAGFGSGFEGGFDFGGNYGGAGDYSDFFESMFGGGRSGRSSRPSRKQKGEDVNATIKVPLTDTFTGSTRRINFELKSTSPDGQVTIKPVNLNVKIPKGIKNGQKIRLAGQGSPGYNGGENGDIYLKIEFEKHPYFRAVDNDIYINLPVAPWEAVLGSSVVVPLPSGNIKLKVPAGTTQGKKLRVKGKGIPAKKPGDAYVVIDIVLPPADTEKAKKVYKEMQELEFDPRKNFGG